MQRHVSVRASRRCARVYPCLSGSREQTSLSPSLCALRRGLPHTAHTPGIPIYHRALRGVLLFSILRGAEGSAVFSLPFGALNVVHRTRIFQQVKRLTVA
ncbi:hypothetical protein AAFF_G00165580 [Aldrovandia affinis]|uniref:Uncharacterized protein n=1 Tax=Aldrovandia affinis TaxID=143900 RepID=A0AAD7RMU1_9TELE|nr:hypothetical protein AAFF_G00165580 [Aldrovandia affinis]